MAEELWMKSSDMKTPPKVSVVILSKNPPKDLMSDLYNQTFKDFEVIFASEEGIVNAMNKALKKARGQIFVRIDDDVSLPCRWLENIVGGFYAPDIAGVTGPTFIPEVYRKNRDSIKAAEKPNWFLRWMFDFETFAPAAIFNSGCVSYDSNFFEKFVGYFGTVFKQYEPDHLEGTNWAMRTNLIRHVGGFDHKFDGVAEWFDDDVVFKIKKLGYRLAYHPGAYLYHKVEKGPTYAERFEGVSRLRNWLRFHWRHSKFHHKKVIWFLAMCGYILWRKNTKSK